MRDAATNPAAEARDQAPAWTRRFLWLLLGVTLLRAIYAALFPLDLAGDEAYYWDWGRALDWGYYSKPPMVGWLMALVSWVGHDTFFAVKLAPLLLVAGGIVFLFLLTRDLYGARTAFWTAAAMMALPATAALSLLFTIDAPLFFFWSGSLWLAWRWLERRGAFGYSLALCLALGAGYLSKQIELVFPLMLMLFLALSAPDRVLLRRPQLYLVVGASLLSLIPVVAWNAQHHWITLEHTAQHFEAPDWRIGKVIARPLEFLGSQALLCSPVLWFLLLAGLVVATVRWGSLGRRERFLLCFSAAALVPVHAMSIWQRVHPNWPLVFYLAGLVLLGGWAVGPVDLGARLSRWRRYFTRGIGVALALSLLAYLLPFAISASPWAGSKLDPTERLRGWRDLGRAVDRVYRSMPRHDQTFVVVTSRRQVASQLAFYMPSHPRVYRVEDPRRISSQYGIWGGPQDKRGWDALIVADAHRESPPDELLGSFQTILPLGTIDIPIGPHDTARRVRLFRGIDFIRWPYPPPSRRGDGTGPGDAR